MKNKGLYIVIEGTIGTGKTTQSKKLTNWLKETYPNKEITLTREPGGTEIAENIRKTVQGTKYEEEMEPICEAYLYASARAQSLRKIVKPTLDKNGIVVSDRSFLTSTANQGGGREMGIDIILEINKPAIKNLKPDTVLYFDLPVEEGIKRVFDEEGDKFESLGIDFYTKVQNAYKEMSQKKGYFKHWINIDASGTEEEVFERIKNSVKDLLI